MMLGFWSLTSMLDLASGSLTKGWWLTKMTVEPESVRERGEGEGKGDDEERRRGRSW